VDWFEIRSTPLAGLAVVQRHVREDTRGFFGRFYCADELAAAGFALPVVQINQTRTLRRGAVRGLHFQRPPHAEDKFVSCLRGEVFDVAVDLRRGSPTFLRWHAEVLSAENRKASPTVFRRWPTAAKCSTCTRGPTRPKRKARYT
jgi:dTDP-4-dehydrorhamnose 3,5-epimerase